MSRARQLSRLSLLAVLACLAVYVVALGTSFGLEVDDRALPQGTTGETWDQANVALRRAVNTISVATIALALAVAAFIALRRKRNDLVLIALGTLGGANVTTFVLKPLLARANPLGGETDRVLDTAFPSGHATAAMSIALVAVMVVPRRWRGWLAVLASGYAGAVGVGLVLILWHYPSDVVGGFLVATAWAAAMAAIFLARREAPPVAPDRRPYAAGAVLAAAVAALLLAPASQLGHGVFAVSAVAIAAVALVLPVGLTLVLARRL